MLHIKLYGITKCSNMVANNLPADPPPPLLDPRGQKVKLQNLQNMVMLHIKFIGIMKCSNMVANILPADPPDPRGQNSTLSEHGHVTYQICLNHKMQ